MMSDNADVKQLLENLRGYLIFYVFTIRYIFPRKYATSSMLARAFWSLMGIVRLCIFIFSSIAFIAQLHQSP